MPRIAFNHSLIEDWYAKTDEGTSTFDVCNSCFQENSGDTADTLGLSGAGYNGDPIPPDAEPYCTGSEPYDIEDCRYICEICGCKLNDKNYYA